VYQTRLAEEQKAAVDLSSLQREIADKDAAIQAAKDRLVALKAQTLRGDESINKLLGMVLGGNVGF
jgi:hypothetical protein